MDLTPPPVNSRRGSIARRLALLFLAVLSVAAAKPDEQARLVRVASKPYANLPQTAQGRVPARLSQTGVFAHLRKLQPVRAAIPYELILPFWSDGAAKSRFVLVPAGKVGFSPTGEWTFPPGTVFVKTFDLPVDEGDPARLRRLETRLLVIDRNSGVYGVVYRWRADLSDADLLDTARTESVAIRTADGVQRTQTWYYPSREDCLACHTAGAGGVLGVKTRQMNRDIRSPSGAMENQLGAWNRRGLFSDGFAPSQIDSYPRLARGDDPSRSLTERARSYLDANCAQCHRPGGTVANFDARFDTPLEQQSLVDGRVLIDQGIDRARVIAPNDPWRSIALARIDTNGDTRMPPLARLTIDSGGVALIRQWIASLPGRAVLDPPVISPAGGHFRGSVTVTLAAEPGAEVHYTLDGSAPGEQDPRYEQPLVINGPVVLRARAYREGFTRSIVVQQVFLADE